MADAATKRMTVEEFFVWQQAREERYELVDGVPAPMVDPITMMTGASSLHDRITSNTIGTLYVQLRGTRCWPATADLGLRTRIRSLRRADVLVTCDEPSASIYEAQEPRMVVEVLSPSNVGLPWQRKIEEYRQHGKLVYLLLIASDAAQATLISRDTGQWQPADFDGLEAIVPLPAIGCSLPLAEVYAGTQLTGPEVSG